MDPLSFPAAADEEPAVQYADNAFQNGDTLDGPSCPPPPYESVMMSDSVVMGAADGNGMASRSSHSVPPPEKSDFEIFVTDPVKQGDGVGAYVSYKVVTKTTLEQYTNKHCEVIRRFRDFVWLHDRLLHLYKGIIIPPVPEKNVVQKYQMTKEFIELRQMALTVFINRVGAHPVLKRSKELQTFLEASEEDWALEVNRVAGETTGARKKFAGVAQMFKDLQHSTANLMSGRSDDEEEDPEYLKVRDYIFQLEGHLAEAHRQAARLIKRQLELGQATQEFGKSMEGLGKFEDGRLADGFLELGNKSDCLSRFLMEQATSLATSFEAPLKEFVRLVKSAKQTIQDRSTALAALTQARDEVDSRRTKLAKLRGTPGLKEEKVAEAERDLNEAQHKAEAAKQAYEGIVQSMSEELARFQRERAQEMSMVLRDFAVAQAQLASDTAKVWRTLVPVLSNLQD